MAFSGDQKTRLGLAGFTRPKSATFAGKEEQSVWTKAANAVPAWSAIANAADIWAKAVDAVATWTKR